MNWRSLTKLIMGLVIVALIIYDVIAYARGGYTATISAITLDMAHGMPLIPLAVGVVLGHLFWPQPAEGKWRTPDEQSPSGEVCSKSCKTHCPIAQG